MTRPDERSQADLMAERYHEQERMKRDRGAKRGASLDDLLGQRDQAAKDSQVRYLTGSDKEAWAATETPFMVKAVTQGEGEFGKRWELVVQVTGEDEERILTISRNRARDPLLYELQRLCRQNDQGPLVLDTVELEDGKTFQWFKRPSVHDRIPPEVRESLRDLHKATTEPER